MFQLRAGIRETFVDKLFSLNSVKWPTLIDMWHLKTSFFVCYCYNYGTMQRDDCRSDRNGKKKSHRKCKIFYHFINEKLENINTLAASYLNTQGLNNSCLKSPASTLVDLNFQSRALRSFSLNQLRNLSL